MLKMQERKTKPAPPTGRCLMKPHFSREIRERERSIMIHISHVQLFWRRYSSFFKIIHRSGIEDDDTGDINLKNNTFSCVGCTNVNNSCLMV